jgi:hypothetical protein
MLAAVDGIQATVFDGCGHYPHHQHTEAFARALLRFLNDPTVVPARLREVTPEVAVVAAKVQDTPEPRRPSWVPSMAS